MRLFRNKKPVAKPADNTRSVDQNQTRPSTCSWTKKIRTLHYLERFGWLTLRQVAQLLYAERPSDPHAQVYKKTRKLMYKLYAEKLIYIRILPNDSRAYLLTKKGARYLSNFCGKRVQHGENILKAHPTLDRVSGKRNGRKSTSNHWLHRWVSNQFVIENGVEDALTEVEIYRRNAPFPWQEDRRDGIAKPAQAWREKIPDALLMRKESGRQYLTWVEVENARRRHGDDMDRDHGEHPGSLESLALWLSNARHVDIIHKRVRIERFVFVIVTRPGEKSRKRQLLDPIIYAIEHHIMRFIDPDDARDANREMPDKLMALYRWIEVQEYVLGNGPQLLEIHATTADGRVQTLADVIAELNLEDMQKSAGYYGF